MSVSPQPGRLVSFTLADVPLEIRRRHGAALLKAARDNANLLEALTIKRAIENPSARVYQIREAAWRRALAGR